MEDKYRDLYKRYEAGEIEKPEEPQEGQSEGETIYNTSESEIALHGARKDPDNHMEHVAKAAERNEAIERLYELRQEVKDKARPSTGVLDDEKLEAEEIKENSISVPDAAPDAATTDTDEDLPAVPPPVFSELPAHDKQRSRKPSMYRQAMLSGFFTALALLIALIVFYWVLA